MGPLNRQSCWQPAAPPREMPPGGGRQAAGAAGWAQRPDTALTRHSGPRALMLMLLQFAHRFYGGDVVELAEDAAHDGLPPSRQQSLYGRRQARRSHRASRIDDELEFWNNPAKSQ